MKLEALKYVCDHAGGGVVPMLAYLHVYEDAAGAHRAQVGNGRYTVDVPTDLPLCTVNADKILAAWQACKGDEPKAECTDANLMVKAGRIKARIPLADPAKYPRTEPTPKSAHTAPGVSALLRRIQPFVATDASRPWATSVCLKSGFAYATNNVILLRAPFPCELPGATNLPGSVFDAVMARGEPVELGADEHGMTFYFEDGVWIKTQLTSGDWPTAVVDGFVDQLEGDDWDVPHPDLGAMIDKAVRVADARVPVLQLTGHGIKLTDDSFEADELDPVPDQGRLNARMSALVFGHATAVKWHQPKQDVHAFKVDDIVGVFGGMR